MALKEISSQGGMVKCGMAQNLTRKFRTIAKCLFKPVDSSSLGVVRSLFGLMMVLDVVHERGLHDLEDRFGDPMRCHFPFFHNWVPLPFHYMGLVYFIMWIGAFGICIGYKFRTSCVLFILPYWYIFFLDKTAWNNHSYLYGLVSILFLSSSAHYSFSVDAIINKDINGKPVPLWNYWIIRFQFFLLYFYAGLKKMDLDWIGGHSMSNLGKHWVFDPFRLILTDEQIDLWIIHIFGFVFDLTVGFWLLIEKTRPVAILFASSFHLMNSRLFYIGQFPYVCLVTTPIFCHFSWPKQLKNWYGGCSPEADCIIENKEKSPELEKLSRKERSVLGVLAFYVVMQLFLPYSHAITKGYNNWTNGLYGYSWDMMVHSWDTTLITISVVDHDTGKTHYLNPDAWVRTTRYSKHADMMVQYAQCLKRNLKTIADQHGSPELQNISIYIDVWCSLNKRFQQRVFDPYQDLLTAEWHPFKKTTWLLPLLTELTPWRSYISSLHSEVLKWSNYSDSLFIADFPGLTMEHYINEDIKNVTVTVLQGAVQVLKNKSMYTLTTGEYVKVPSGDFHEITTVSNIPSCLVYTFVNNTDAMTLERGEESSNMCLEIFNGWYLRYLHFVRSLQTLVSCFKKIAATLT